MLFHRNSIVYLIIAIVVGTVVTGYAGTSVEWRVQKSLQLSSTPVDVAVTTDGSMLFVLTQERQILIYDATGQFIDKIEVRNDFDRIKVGPNGAYLILSSRKNKSVQTLSLDFIYDINVSGSPFKGSADAPVAVVVFEDFQ